MIRSVFTVVAVALLIASISTIALGAPVLSWIGPSKCMSGTVESQHFELDGTNLVGPSTNGYTFQNDVKLYLPLARKREASDHRPRRALEHHDPDDIGVPDQPPGGGAACERFIRTLKYDEI
jgi:hypothetical protein